MKSYIMTLDKVALSGLINELLEQARKDITNGLKFLALSILNDCLRIANRLGNGKLRGSVMRCINHVRGMK